MQLYQYSPMPKPQRITHYQVMLSHLVNVQEFEISVSIKNGWQPFGNLIMDESGNLLQTMVKYAIDENGNNE
jgi:hypothetical protein